VADSDPRSSWARMTCLLFGARRSLKRQVRVLDDADVEAGPFRRSGFITSLPPNRSTNPPCDQDAAACLVDLVFKSDLLFLLLRVRESGPEHSPPAALFAAPGCRLLKIFVSDNK